MLKEMNGEWRWGWGSDLLGSHVSQSLRSGKAGCAGHLQASPKERRPFANRKYGWRIPKEKASIGRQCGEPEARMPPENSLTVILFEHL